VNQEAPITLLLVDDHPVVRDGLRRIQELEPRIEIVATAGTRQETVAAARQFRPEVILMDVRLPDGDGIQACREVRTFLPECHVLFLTSYADNRFVLAAMEAGADGYLLKESDTRRIVSAIHSIVSGGTVFDPVVARELAGAPHNGGGNTLAILTPLETRVLAEVAIGKTDKEVAAALSLTPKTARNYVTRVFTKLNVHTRTEAALLYTRSTESVPPPWESAG
jgi:DNA-binding NarL/FixJ family response regulator